MMFDAIMGVNVKGVWLCMKYQLPLMLAPGRWVDRQYRFGGRVGGGAEDEYLCGVQARGDRADQIGSD
jgi:NAD(P)-dependent dehydrogenase (short-subunit alcohol dehydrogenase family)